MRLGAFRVIMEVFERSFSDREVSGRIYICWFLDSGRVMGVLERVVLYGWVIFFMFSCIIR